MTTVAGAAHRGRLRDRDRRAIGKQLDAHHDVLGRRVRELRVVGQDEVGPKQIDEQVPENPLSPANVLVSLMREKNISFDQIKKRLAKDKFEGAETLADVNSIPKTKIFELIERIRAKA